MPHAITNVGIPGPSTIPYELFPIFIPLLYGIFGLINYYIISKYGNNYSIIVGMALGILLSIIGRFGFTGKVV